MTSFIQSVTSKEQMLAEIEFMNACGPRYTGSAAQQKYVDHIKEKLTEMGVSYYTDPYRFKNWEEKRSGLYVKNGTEYTPVHISSAYPYSGKTDADGIEAKLKYVKNNDLGLLSATGKIAVVNIKEVDFLPSELAFDHRKSQPEDLALPAKYRGPVATAFVNAPLFGLAKAAGVKALVLVWRGMSDAMVEGQYLSFIEEYHGIPAVWVNSTDGDRLIEDAKAGKTAKLILEATRDRNASTETVYAILPGEDTRESIIVNTHTDGTNCIEENGPVALLSLIEFFKDKPRKKNLIFIFITGHLHLTRFRELDGGGFQATSKWLSNHRDLWDGKRGHLKALAGVSVEHLGCKMWKDVAKGYVQVGDVDPELVYTGNQQLDDLYYECLEGREKVNTITLRGHNCLHWGEGQPLFNCGIPEIALVTAPDCLCVVSDNDEMDKFDIDLMYEQTDTFIKIISRLLTMGEFEIGKADGYSLLLTKDAVEKSALKKLLG